MISRSQAFGVKFNALVALLQHLDQLAGIGMVMAGREHADVVADVDAANVGDQGFVGGRVADVAFVERLVLRVHPRDVETTRDAASIVVDEFFRPKIASVGSAVVAVDAVLVEHRLHFASEVEAARGAVPRVEFARRTVGRQAYFASAASWRSFRGSRRRRRSRPVWRRTRCASAARPCLRRPGPERRRVCWRESGKRPNRPLRRAWCRGSAWRPKARSDRSCRCPPSPHSRSDRRSRGVS